MILTQVSFLIKKLVVNSLTFESSKYKTKNNFSLKTNISKENYLFNNNKNKITKAN
jgi:hypothetical protein